MGGTASAARVALVTGAGSGIGRSAALALLAEGWEVALVGRRPGMLEETAAAAGEGAGRAMPVACDVTDPQAVESAFAELRGWRSRLDLVFNNAGGNTPSTSFGELSWAQWRQVLSVNLDGAFLVAQAAFRAMRDQDPPGGRIINNGSISAHVPRPGSAPYTASKHAITGLTRSISLDGRRYNIACGQIDIGNAASAMTQRMNAGVPQADGTTRTEPVMDVAIVGRAIAQMAALPLEANVQFMTIMATHMPFIGRG